MSNSRMLFREQPFCSRVQVLRERAASTKGNVLPPSFFLFNLPRLLAGKRSSHWKKEERRHKFHRVDFQEGKKNMVAGPRPQKSFCKLDKMTTER
eukprot:190904-Amphidinium_carterae.2